MLPVLYKIIEKHVANSLKYLQENNLLYKLQSAFRSGHYTETALIRITDEILFKMDNDEVTGLVFVDFRKAFDVINHNLLLKTLYIYIYQCTVPAQIALPGFDRTWKSDDIL